MAEVVARMGGGDVGLCRWRRAVTVLSTLYRVLTTVAVHTSTACTACVRDAYTPLMTCVRSDCSWAAFWSCAAFLHYERLVSGFRW